MNIKPIYNSEYWIKRVPFFRTFNNNGNEKSIGFEKGVYNENVTVSVGSEGGSFIAKHFNTFSDFQAYVTELGPGRFNFNFALRNQLVVIPQIDNDDPMPRIVARMMETICEKETSWHNDFVLPTNDIPPAQMDQIVNEINKHLFKFEEYVDHLPANLKPAFEQKTFIKNRLHEALGDRILPQDPNAELNAISNPFQKHIRPMSQGDLNMVITQNTNAKQVSLAYRQAFKSREPSFSVQYKGNMLRGTIPPSFFADPNNINYFDDPNLGDGGFQVREDKRGYLQAGTVKAAPKMADRPNLGSATDAGAYYDYQGTYRYFRVQIGMQGKYQEEAKKYCIFQTPAIDAEIKTRVCFHKEIMSFLQPTSYVDASAKDVANAQTSLYPMLKAIRLKAEEQLGTVISHLPFWKEYLKNFEYRYEKAPFTPDIDKEVQDVVNKYKQSNLFRKPLDKQPISMDDKEKQDWELQQKEKAAKLAAWKAKHKKP